MWSVLGLVGPLSVIMSMGYLVSIYVYIYLYMCRCVCLCVDMYMCMNMIV